MLTLETCDLPVLDDYASDHVEAYEENEDEGYQSLNNSNARSDEQTQPLWNYQGSNVVSDLINKDMINENEFNKRRFDVNLVVKGMTFANKEKMIYEGQNFNLKYQIEYMNYNSDKSRLCFSCKKGKEVCS